MVGGEQRCTEDTVNLVEWVIGDADDWMTDFAVAGVVVFAVFGAASVAQLLLHGAARPRGDRHRPARAPIRLLLVVLALEQRSLALFLSGAVFAGLGQGWSSWAAWRPSIVSHPADQRGETISSYLVVSYVAIAAR